MSIQQIHRLLRGTASAAALLALALLAQGCVADNDDDCPAPPAPENNITLQFMVVTPSPAGRSAVSRADNCVDDEQGTAAENYINTADMQFFLFDADRKLLRTFRPEITSKDNTLYTWYELKAMFNEPYFDEAVKSGQENVSFYILVTANTSGLGGQYFGVVPGTTTIDDMAQQLRTFNCPDRADEYYISTEWRPDIDAKQFIPMSGLQQFTVSTADLVASTYEDPVNLSPSQEKEIPMLRAMAKIEVIDHLEFAEGEEYDANISRMMIEKVELCGFNSTGTILPWMGTASGNTGYNLPQWTDVSINVVNPTIPGNNPYIGPNPFTPAGYAAIGNNQIITFYGTVYDIGNKPIGATGFPTFTAYIPEYSLAAIGNDKEKPYIVVTLTNSKGDIQGESPIKQLKLVRYIDGAPQDNQPIEEMLRNHIYRYQVNSADNPENIISVGYTVCPWYEPTVDIPSFD